MAGEKRMRLTDAAIARLRAYEREYTVWDTRIPSLGVRVRPSGGASFVLLHQADGRSRRKSLGSVMSQSVDTVRRQCHAIISELESNGTTKQTPDIPLFRDFVERSWKQAHFPKYKPSTRIHAEAALANQLLPALGATPLDRITRSQALRWFDGYSQTAPGGANHTLQLLRQILNFAIVCGHIGTNPARGIKMNRRAVLTRFLSRAEIQRLHRTLDERLRIGPGSRQQAEIIRLLLLTGCRRNEIISLRWSEVHGDTLALADSKTGPRTVPLNAQARRLIESQPRGQSPFVFPFPTRHQPSPESRTPSVVLGAQRSRLGGCSSSRPPAHASQSRSHERRPSSRGFATARPQQRANDPALCTLGGQGR